MCQRSTFPGRSSFVGDESASAAVENRLDLGCMERASVGGFFVGGRYGDLLLPAAPHPWIYYRKHASAEVMPFLGCLVIQSQVWKRQAGLDDPIRVPSMGRGNPAPVEKSTDNACGSSS